MGRIVNETRLNYYTEKLWERIKTQLTDNTFKSAELLPNSTIVQFTKNNNQTVDVDLAKFMNRYYSVADMGTAEANRGTYQNGDVIHTQDDDKKYLCINMGAADFQDAIIELTPQQGINLPIDATDVNYDNQNTNLVALNVQAAIDELSTKVKNSYIDSEYDKATGILTLIKEDGTRDPHEFGSGLIKNVTYDIQTQMLNIETVDGQTLTADLTDLASKTLDNYFEGENLFDKLFITTDKPYIGNANEYIRNAGGHKQTGRRDYTSHSNGNNGYVDNLIIRLANNLATNRIIQVKYWIVEKGATVAQDNIIKEVDYQECNVEEEPSLGASARIMRVPVKMKFDKPVYFIYQVYTSADMAYTSINVGNESLYLDVQNENTPLSVSILENNIGQGDGVNHSGSYAISGGSTNVRDLLNSAGTVTSVNGQSPIAGEVTVKSEHIPYDNQTSNLASDNVKGAIDELNGKFVSNVRYEVADRSLKQTKNGQESDIVTGIVTQWKDLDYVKEFANTNIVDYSKVQKNTSLNSGFEYAYNASGEWGVVTFPVTEGEQYTLLRQRQYHVRIRFEDGTGTKVGHVDSPAPANKNWHRCVFNAPVGATKGVLEVRVAQDNEKDVMIFAGDQTDLTVDVNNPIPFFDNKFLQIGTEMSYAFDNSNSNLNSTTVESAIKELDGKVTNAGTVKTVNSQQADAAGNVIINSEHIRYDNTTSHLVSDNVKAAIDELKNDMALLNSSDIFIVPDNAELSTLLGQNTLNHGDLVYIIDSTDVVDFTNTNVNNGSDPVAMIYDNNITTGNKLRIFSKFSTTINISADNVSYDDTDTQLGVDNVQEAVKALNYKIGTTGVSDVVYNGDKTLTVTKNGQPTAYDLSPLVGIKTINNQAGTDGAITLSVDDTTNNIQFKVAGQTFGTLDYMTEQDANDIINSFTF